MKVFIHEGLVEEGYRRCIHGLEGQTELLLAVQLERIGGPCPICGKHFAKIEVDNQYGKFHYFKPDCWCFKRCERVPINKITKAGATQNIGYAEGCGRYLVAETFLGIDFCTSCRGSQEDRKPRKVVRRSARQVDGKAAAAGDE